VHGYQQILGLSPTMLLHITILALRSRAEANWMKPLPATNAPLPNFQIDYSDSQVPPCEDYLYSNLDYHIEGYAY
jgi:hypothetical protein